jgi:hypothetical protein
MEGGADGATEVVAVGACWFRIWVWGDCFAVAVETTEGGIVDVGWC